MGKLYIKTPVIKSQYLKNKLDINVYLKIESLQPSGSFKLRGISNLCQQEIKKGAKSFVASSGGNAGVAVAYCGACLNVPTTIFIPKSSAHVYIEAIKSYGAEVIIAGDNAGDAQIKAMEYAIKIKASYIHPYDNPYIWEGHSSIIDEIVDDNFAKPDAIIVAVGGGGLACGILTGMHKHNWNNVPFIAVETEGADVFAQSVAQNKAVHLPVITSKATSLGATYVASRLLQFTHEHKIQNVVVSDLDAENGSRAFAKDKRILVELASGSALSLVYDNHPIIKPYKSILVIVCGGINVSQFNLDGE